MPVCVHAGELNENVLMKFQCVVLTNTSLDEQLRIGDITHKNGLKLIVADTRGLFGYMEYIFFCPYFMLIKLLD